MIFYWFAYTSRSIAFAYITGIKEDFILHTWGVCHLWRTPWLLVTIFIILSRPCPGTGARDKIWRGDKYKIAQKIFCRKNRVTCLLRPRPLRAYVATCLCASNYYVQTCLSSFYYYVPKCLYVTSCLRALNCYVPTCPSVFFYYVPLRAYVPACLSALNYYVLTRLRALNYYEPTCPHFSCAFICLRANIYFSCLRTFVS